MIENIIKEESVKPSFNRLVIIAGVNGEIGSKYQEYFEKEKNTKCLGIGRQKLERQDYLQADLLDQKQTEEATKAINLANIDELIYIHAVGQFKFEDKNHPIIDKNGDGIDDIIYATNYQTFENFITPLLKKVEDEHNRGHKIKVAISGIASITDKCQVRQWKSFTKAKNDFRNKVMELVNNPTYEDNVRGIIVSVSTVDGKQLRSERPHIHDYVKPEELLTPDEIVQKSIRYICDRNIGYLELPIFKNMEGFNHTLLTDERKVSERWYKEMYGEKVTDEKTKT